MASPQAIEIVDPDEFTTAYYTGLGWTEREARRKVRQKLETHNIFLNPANIDPTKLAIGFTEGDAINGGVAWALCNSNGSTPVAGKPLVLDPVSGNRLTGIGADWYLDEYMVVATAIKDGTGATDEHVLVRLQRRDPIHDGMLLKVKTTEQVPAGDKGEAEIWRWNGSAYAPIDEFIELWHLWITGGGQAIPAEKEANARWCSESNRFESHGFDC